MAGMLSRHRGDREFVRRMTTYNYDKPRIEDEFLEHLREATGECDWSREYRPTLFRKWRVDIVCVSLMIAIEIEGERHGSAKQRRSDSEKQNFMTAHGWICLRYPASSVRNKKRRERIVEQIRRIVFGVQDDASDSCVLIGE